MYQKIKELITKYREIITYIIVGGLNTIVSWMAYFLCVYTFLDAADSFEHFIANTISWIVGVTCFYPLNRKWVFRSTNPHVLKEFAGFAGSRLFTWILDVVVMWVTVNVMNVPEWIAKVFISAVLVTIINYVLSKVVIFRKRDE